MFSTMTHSKKKKRTGGKPTPGIRCLVLDENNRPLKYDPIEKRLYYSGGLDFTEFPTKRQALHARHHQIERDKKANIKMPWLNYKVEEA